MKTIRANLLPYLAALLSMAAAPYAGAAAAINQSVQTYVDPSGVAIPFRWGVDTNKVQQITFPANVTGPQQTEVLQNPYYSNYGATGVYPTVTTGPLFPAGTVSPTMISADVAESASFVITTGQVGVMFQVTTGASNINATLPSAAAAGDGWYCFLRKVDTGLGFIVTIPSLSTAAGNCTVNAQSQVFLVWTDGTNFYSRGWMDSPNVFGDINIISGRNVGILAGPTGTGLINLNGGTVGSTQTTGGNAPILGTNTNDLANAGLLGQIITSQVVVGSAVSLTAGVTANITSISLTAGDWDVWTTTDFVAGTATTLTIVQGGLSTTNSNFTYQDGNFAQQMASVTLGTGNTITYAGPTLPIQLATPTTIYFNATATFAVSTLKAYGSIWARRRR